MNKQQKTWWCIGGSLGLHALAVILLVGLSGTALMPRQTDRLDVVLVSFSAPGEITSFPTRTAPGPHAAGSIIRAAAPPAKTAAEDIRMEPGKTENAASFDPERTALPLAVTTLAVKTEVGGRSVDTVSAEAAAGAGTVPVSSSALPLYRENPPPGYPAMAREQGYEGVVLVKAEVLTNGRVGQTVIRKSSGYAILDEAAVNAVKTWKFEPARKSGTPYKTWAELPIKFVISDRNS